jgi:serine/threonine protein kinase
MKIMEQLDSTTMNELELFSEINHDNIVRYFDHFHKRFGGEYQTFLITEYCEVCRHNWWYNHLSNYK